MNWRTDFHSKMVDGVAPALLLILFSNVNTILIVPVQSMFGKPGLLIFTLCLLAVGVVCLERSVVTRFEDTWRAWYGAVGGMLIWQVILLTNQIGNVSMVSETSIMTLLILVLITAVLWRRITVLGPRFFLQTILFSWAGYVFVVEQYYLIQRSGFFDITLKLTFWGAVLASLITLVWIMRRSKTRVDRLNGAVLLWICVMIAINVAFRIWVI